MGTAAWIILELWVFRRLLSTHILHILWSGGVKDEEDEEPRAPSPSMLIHSRAAVVHSVFSTACYAEMHLNSSFK